MKKSHWVLSIIIRSHAPAAQPSPATTRSRRASPGRNAGGAPERRELHREGRDRLQERRAVRDERHHGRRQVDGEADRARVSQDAAGRGLRRASRCRSTAGSAPRRSSSTSTSATRPAPATAATSRRGRDTRITRTAARSTSPRATGRGSPTTLHGSASSARCRASDGTTSSSGTIRAACASAGAGAGTGTGTTPTPEDPPDPGNTDGATPTPAPTAHAAPSPCRYRRCRRWRLLVTDDEQHDGRGRLRPVVGRRRVLSVPRRALVSRCLRRERSSTARARRRTRSERPSGARVV